MASSDAELVRAAAGGEHEAFAELVRRHEVRVYNLALRMTGRPEDARDATQDAFLTAWRKLGSFRGDAAFGTWLHRVAMNTCYDLLRKRSRQPMLDRLPEHEPEGPPQPDPADETVGAVDVQRALDAVAPEHRAVLVLHDVRDLSYEDVAAILQVPVGTVKSRLHRARLALAQAMSAAGEHPDPDRSSDGTVPT